MIWARGATDGAENAKAKRTELEHGAQIKKVTSLSNLAKVVAKQLHKG